MCAIYVKKDLTCQQLCAYVAGLPSSQQIGMQVNASYHRVPGRINRLLEH